MRDDGAVVEPAQGYSALGGSTRTSSPTLHYEHSLLEQGYSVIAGVDEVGRGSWAGPVVAAAVILPVQRSTVLEELSEVRDSKQLSPQQRLCAANFILRCARAAAIGWATHHVVDDSGLTAANMRAMLRAVTALRIRPEVLLIDHFSLPACELPQTSVTRGDSLCLSIAAASILAKVTRDRWMAKCDTRFPGYGFAQHKGYGTPAHRRALHRLGPSPIHRLSFAPLHELRARSAGPRSTDTQLPRVGPQSGDPLRIPARGSSQLTAQSSIR